MQAWTKNPNTPETDKLPTVPHIVQFDDGRQVEVQASDPMAAIDKVMRNLEHYQSIAKPAEKGDA